MSLSSVSSSWLRRNVAQALSCGTTGSERMHLSSGSASPRASDSHRLLVEQERELHVQLVAVAVAEVARQVLQRRVDLAEQHRLARGGGRRTSAGSRSQPLAGRRRCSLHAVGLEQERDGVHAEARRRRAASQNPTILRDLVADGRVGDVEVGLEAVEAVQVVLAGLVGLAAQLLVSLSGNATPFGLSEGSSRQTYQSR